MNQPELPTCKDHADFVDAYDEYLDGIYGSLHSGSPADGRRRLARSIASEMECRGATRVLDCAAGTGFPALDLAGDPRADFQIHCSDGDPAMIAAIEKRAADRGLDLRDLAPPRSLGCQQTNRAMTIGWARLDQIKARYDYILCRGNSLVYADTWRGRRRVAPDGLLRHYLDRMGQQLRPGGYLHVDAPWRFDLSTTSYRTMQSRSATIREEVVNEGDARKWTMTVTRPGQEPLTFERYSCLLTIYRVAEILEELGFEETKPFELAGERPNFGVIIARRPA